jgi:hypothetical protein
MQLYSRAHKLSLLLLLHLQSTRCHGVSDTCHVRFKHLSDVVQVCSGSATTSNTACDCACIPNWRQRQCQRDAKPLNALALAACADKLPPSFNVDTIKQLGSACCNVLSSSGVAVSPDLLLADLFEECADLARQGGCARFSRGPVSLSARCGLAGQCAARIVDALSCKGDICKLDVVRYPCTGE